MKKKTKEAFDWIIKIFRDNNIPFQLSGGLAAKIYGSPKDLWDIDFDIPDSCFSKVRNLVSKYVIFGPKKTTAEGFDCMLLRLNYHGQQIDVSGNCIKIFDKVKKKWVKDNTDFERSAKKRVFDRIVPVICPEDLLKYKSKLSRKADSIDIKALKKYLLQKNK
ncbi:MAG TPA: hypothetical protein P5548_01415 [Candidatus Moranbacteria bacterium]|nr:hypothetical protein [Candidatus Moranbacteria bacterium]HRZ33548.1 hypothetical protein [Candidatus Moranbacteria bacterium]